MKYMVLSYAIYDTFKNVINCGIVFNISGVLDSHISVMVTLEITPRLYLNYTSLSRPRGSVNISAVHSLVVMYGTVISLFSTSCQMK